MTEDPKQTSVDTQKQSKKTKSVGRPRKHPIVAPELKKPRGRPKKSEIDPSIRRVDDDLDMKDVAVVSTNTTIAQLLSEIENLKLQNRDHNQKLEVLDKVRKKAEVGTHTYGCSTWKDWTSGSEHGYCRSLYVDIKTMLMPRAY